MRRVVLLALAALVSLPGCKPAAPPPQPAPSLDDSSPPVQESVSYLKDAPKVHGYLCRPDMEGASPAVLIIHDRMGLTEGIKDETFRLAREGYVVLAVDLYRGQTPKTAKDAERLERELPKKRALDDLKSAVDYLSERPEVRSEKNNPKSKNLGVLGLGMGGVYALDLALVEPRLRAVALCYCPLSINAEQLMALKATVFGVFAGRDKNVPPDVIERFSKAMYKAGKRIDAIRVYSDSSHGFLDPADWPTYGKPSEKDVGEVWELITRYFDRELS